MRLCHQAPHRLHHTLGSPWQGLLPQIHHPSPPLSSLCPATRAFSSSHPALSNAQSTTSSFRSFSLRRSVSVPTPAPSVSLLVAQPIPLPLSSSSPTFSGQPEATHPPSRSHPAPVTTRVYKPRGNIQESSYRPPVRASERLFNWRTPHGLDADREFEAAVPPGFAETIRAHIQSCYAPNTMSTYGAGLLRFTEFLLQIYSFSPFC